MEYIYAVLLLHNAKKEINEENIKKVLVAAGLTPDDTKIKGMVTALKEVNISEAIEKASTPVAVAAAPAQEKKEEKPKEPEVTEETAAEGLGALFG